jgi:hypothetical protein
MRGLLEENEKVPMKGSTLVDGHLAQLWTYGLFLRQQQRGTVGAVPLASPPATQALARGSATQALLIEFAVCSICHPSPQ